MSFLSPSSATAGFEEAYAAYARGDYHTAFREFMPMAHAGHPSAQFAVGVMYGEGVGVGQNEAEAVRWYRLAADQGFAEAQSALGEMYAFGRGVAQDDAEAVRWFRPAADHGVAEAQFNMGVAHAGGWGAPRDEVLAYMWFNLAAARSRNWEELRERAVAERDKVAARLSPAQRARAQELARNWQPSVAAKPKGGSRAYGQAGSNPFQAEIERRASRNREAQQLLADLGYAPGPVDGVLGPRTRAAIWAFQTGVGLPVDGHVSDELIAALREAAASGQRVAAAPAPAQPRPDGRGPWELYGAAAAPTQRRLDSAGSGFAVSKDGQIVTNHHVVADCAEVRVRPSGQEAVAGVVVALGRDNDLALLHAPARLPAAALRNDNGIRPGDSVVAVGFPLHGLLASEANVTTGTVSALAGIGNDTRFLQMTVPVQPGNSGGPLLDLEGRVVGVVVGKLDALQVASVTGDIPQNVNFAIKAGVVRSFLDASGIGPSVAAGQVDPTAETASPIAQSPATVGAEAKAFTVLVECWK